MNFDWIDYNPETMCFTESWLDESAVASTGMDEGFRDFYEYWANKDNREQGESFCCKVIFESGEPFAVMALGFYDNQITVMEFVVAPEKRGLGKGTEIIKELTENAEAVSGFTAKKFETVIYPGNKASLKAFEKAGFRHESTHPDGDAMNYVYVGD